MQLFILDRDPEKAAQMLCDSHLRKMCLETAQILSSVLYLQGKSLADGMPNPYHPSHPVIRAVDSPEKINWVIRYFYAVQEEYFFRFQKKHAYSELPPMYEKTLFSSGAGMDDFSFSRTFRGFEIPEPDLIMAYRIYYRYKKSGLRYWHYTGREEPEWLRDTLKRSEKII